MSSRRSGGGGGGGGGGAAAAAAATGGNMDPIVAQCVRVYAKGQLLCVGGGGGGGGDDGGGDADAASGPRPAGSSVPVPGIRSGRPSASAPAVVAAEAAADGVGEAYMTGSPAVTTGSDFRNMRWGFFLGGRNIVTFARAAGRLERDDSQPAARERALGAGEQALKVAIAAV